MQRGDVQEAILDLPYNDQDYNNRPRKPCFPFNGPTSGTSNTGAITKCSLKIQANRGGFANYSPARPIGALGIADRDPTRCQCIQDDPAAGHRRLEEEREAPQREVG